MVSFAHSTPAQLLAAIRQRLRGLSGVRVGRVCAWLLANASDAQLKALFGVNDVQLVTLKQRLQDKADKTSAADAIQGEP